MKLSELLEEALRCLPMQVNNGSGVCDAIGHANRRAALCDGRPYLSWDLVAGLMGNRRHIAVAEFSASPIGTYWWPVGEYELRRAFLEHWINELKAKGG